jgi:hypothetical protein
MLRILKSYLFWTYPRGNFHYDVMVTLILAFIFLSPHIINFHDHPVARDLASAEVLVRPNGTNGFIYQVNADQVNRSSSAEKTAALKEALAPISGDVVIDRYELVKDATGRITNYKVWAHR